MSKNLSLHQSDDTTMDTSEIVLMVHGLAGTQHDLGSLKQQFLKKGIQVDSFLLPGHGSSPEDLYGMPWQVWVDALKQKYLELKKTYSVVHMVSICMGSLLVLAVAKLGIMDKREKLVLLSPPVFIDGWSLPWYRNVRYLAYHLPWFLKHYKIKESEPYGVKNEHIRAIVKRKFARNDGFHYSWIPLYSVRELDRLRNHIMQGLSSIKNQMLIIHAIDDELTSVKSAQYIRDQINLNSDQPTVKVHVLTDSYHMICTDNESNEVFKMTLDFLS